MTLGKSDNWIALRYIFPALFAMLIVHIIPIIMGIYLGFLDLNTYTLTQLFGAPFAGLSNFYTIFSANSDLGHRFIGSIYNIIMFGLIVIPAEFIIALGVAMLLNNQFRGVMIARGIILLPFITPDSVMFSVWRFVFQSRIGLVNKYLMSMGIIHEPTIWLVGDNAMIAVIISTIWKGWPYLCLVLLAGLKNIPNELYEASKVDGASWLQRFRMLTLPLLWPVSRTLLLISFIWNFHAFNQFFILFGGETNTKAAVPSIVIMRAAFTNLDYGLGSAMAVVMLVVIFVLTYFWVIKRKEDAE
jgi:multiple sugar transport system permease protein